MYSALKKMLFTLEPEKAHSVAMNALDSLSQTGLGRSLLPNIPETKSIEVAGLSFPNPIGLAAGFDKNALHTDGLAELGFGFVEIGTVTPLPQEGNPKPRLFRLPKDHALLNRMGFNNAGMEEILLNLQNRKNKNLIIGGNIGKNKITPNERAYEDYLKCFDTLYPEVDYFVVNVSSPNTPNLRALQEKEPLSKLLELLQKKNRTMPKAKPIFLKIAPDLNSAELDDILEIVTDKNLDGMVVSNTTIERKLPHYTEAHLEKLGNGGVSGNPVRAKSTDVIKHVHKHTQGKIPLIGVGGIFTAEDAQEKLDAGATLVQIYTGFVYQGPTIVRDILKSITY